MATAATAIAFGLLSTLSPWLWMIHTRGVHRAELRAEDLIDPRTVKLPLMLWLMYPVMALRMLRLAVWNGENKPGTVRAMFAERCALRELSAEDAVAYAYGAGCATPHEVLVWLQARGVVVKPSAVGQAMSSPMSALMSSRPEMSTAQLARSIGVSKRHVRRLRRGSGATD